MKVIITDCDHDNIEIEKKIFADAGIEMELKHAISEDEVIEQCQDAEILIVQYAKITRKVMEHCPRLKFVVRYGVASTLSMWRRLQSLEYRLETYRTTA